MTKPSPEFVAELMRELLPDPPPSTPTAWDLQWPIEGSPAWRMLPPGEQWRCKQARMPMERRELAINSVIEQSLATREAERRRERELDPYNLGLYGPRRHD